MIVPTCIPLIGSRNGVLKGNFNFSSLSLAFTAAQIQVRQYIGAPDPAPLTLTTSGATGAGSTLTLGAFSGGAQSLAYRIVSADLAGLPGGAPRADLAYDLLMTDVTGDPVVWAYGPLELYYGVTGL